MNKIFFSIIVIFAAIFGNISVLAESLPRAFADDFMLGLGDFAYVFGNFPSSGHKFITYPIIASSTTGSAMLLDDEIRFAPDERKKITWLKQPGEPISTFVLAGGIWLGGYFFESDKCRETGRLLVESFVLAASINGSLKYILGRSRPYLDEGNAKFNFFEMKDARQSLPSGHTTVAFSLATVLSRQIDNIYASVALYALATGTGFERIKSDKHWFSDVILGAEIGIYSGCVITSAAGREKSNLSFLPLISPDFVGFNLQYLY